jgi:hypothetical protein
VCLCLCVCVCVCVFVCMCVTVKDTIEGMFEATPDHASFKPHHSLPAKLNPAYNLYFGCSPSVHVLAHTQNCQTYWSLR